MSEVRVLFDPWPGWGDRLEPVPATVVGADGEGFLHLLRRSVDAPLDGALLVIPNEPEREPEYEWRALAIIDEEVTLGGVRHFAAGQAVNISAQAVGGSFIMTLLEWLSTGLTIREVAVWTFDQVQAHVYARQRSTAQAWLRGGSTAELPMELLQMVKAYREWEPTKARAVFGMSDGDLGRLFRSANYGYAPGTGWIELGDG